MRISVPIYFYHSFPYPFYAYIRQNYNPLKFNQKKKRYRYLLIIIDITKNYLVCYKKFETIDEARHYFFETSAVNLDIKIPKIWTKLFNPSEEIQRLSCHSKKYNIKHTNNPEAVEGVTGNGDPSTADGLRSAKKHGKDIPIPPL